MKHKLLNRQIKRYLKDEEDIPQKLRDLLSAVDEAYHQQDDDYSLLEHAIDVLSEEVHEKNSQIEWLSRFPNENPHPVLRISKNGNLYYANSASQNLLKTFGMEVKKEVPKYWKYIVEVTLSKNKNETVEMEVDQEFFSLTFSPVQEENYVNVYGYDITGRKLAENYLLDQNNILGSLAAEDNLQTILNEICLKVEKYTNGLKSSILLLDKSGKFLHYGSAPNLPKEYIEKTRKVLVGNNQGSCGTAVYLKKNVIAEDISKDVHWTKYKEVPLSFNLRSCWSTPIMDTAGNVLGTFALYYHKPRKPIKAELELIKSSANIAALAIHKNRVQKELKSYAAELERSNKELSDFAYIASHDLQEPLRKISIFSDRVLEIKNSYNDTQRGYLERMGKAAGRMRTLIEDLLRLSQVTTTAKPFEKVDLGKIALEVIEDLDAKLQETKGKIKVGELPKIEADPFQMRQLLQNLIDNALKYHKEDVPPQVELNSRYEKKEGWIINIKDNGIGLDEEKFSERIFAPLERLHGHSAYEGTGIGLAICKKIVTRHSGSIFVKSREGQGATFTFTLPKEQPRV
ncbi:MAG: ATP-binding protein [Nitrospinota bacterium]